MGADAPAGSRTHSLRPRPPAPPRYPAAPGSGPPGTAPSQASTPRTQPAASPAPRPDAAILRALSDAQAFYTSQLDGSWAPGYLHARGITPAAIRNWRIGYAPA